ncbi:LEAF RUST 10 DISEASE-RESISTANCE LOCUS RECEPTOR-LIKE PROTEIN KINASE-like protein 2.7 [Cinnamomum micranthum f. kanehirae]|uniref:LEAF RUST 10 DISEASE-RESISTANCE LOCUS RECEPTOR-LIKE PROTEIN KINASE-like protein 2.7 n=1 Tax=Cinnamomum micranthum f. kanehirae TaxID=337451 RepID=A0A3S3NNT0_9MAGN|nr:LEAF RUST 10 DISEASE-RESISTANCE LOCUS RECEPTOR-LIKE PROTEIN KINASE-like protein 2.7 [Cinnamomum micranthum f. kanehirae]
MSQYSSAFFFLFFFTTVNGDTRASYIPQCLSSNCGTLNISYPFWLSDPNSNSYCGYPGFGLSCTNQRPILHLPSDSYYVTQINYTQQTLTLVDIDLAYQSCPRAKHNVSFSLNSNTANPPPSLNYNPIDLNLTFFFNCSFFPSLVEPIPCMNSGGNRSFVFGGVFGEIPRFDWHGRCEESVVVPLLKTEAEGLTLGGFGGALGLGFQVDWFLARNCGVCEASQGYCGYSGINKSFVCYCTDGGYAEHCNYGTSLI